MTTFSPGIRRKGQALGGRTTCRRRRARTRFRLERPGRSTTGTGAMSKIGAITGDEDFQSSFRPPVGFAIASSCSAAAAARRNCRRVMGGARPTHPLVAVSPPPSSAAVTPSSDFIALFMRARSRTPRGPTISLSAIAEPARFVFPDGSLGTTARWPAKQIARQNAVRVLARSCRHRTGCRRT